MLLSPAMLAACAEFSTQMRDWEEIKTKWDGSSTEYLKLDYGLLEVRGDSGCYCCLWWYCCWVVANYWLA